MKKIYNKKRMILGELKKLTLKIQDRIIERTSFADVFLYGGEEYKRIIDQVWENTPEYDKVLLMAMEAGLGEEINEIIDLGNEYLEKGLIRKFKEQLHLDSCYTD